MKYSLAFGAGILALSLLTACASNNKPAPLEESAAHFLLDKNAMLSSERGWWVPLKDKSLNRLVERALFGAQDIRLMKMRLQQAEIMPNFEIVDITVPKGGLTGHQSVSSEKIDQQTFLAFSKQDNAYFRVSSAQQAAWFYEYLQLRQLMAHTVFSKYTEWQALMEKQRLLKMQMALSKDNQKLLQQRRNAGIMASNELYAEETRYQQMLVESIGLERKVMSIRHSLAVLCGLPPHSLYDFQPKKQVLPSELNVAKIKVGLLSQRPDIALFQQVLLKGKQHNKDLLKVSKNWNSTSDILLNQQNKFDFTEHVYSDGDSVNNRQSAESGKLWQQLKRMPYNEQISHYEQVVLNAMRVATDAVNEYNMLKYQEKLQIQVLGSAEKRVRLLQQRFQAGLENKLAYDKYQAEALTLKMKLVDTRKELLQSWSNLYLQLGGSF
ncbi:TolC family protein [Neisseria weaveri]|uniref:TolC family protein n=1 Tax=Neisseria weaveri TaxID=28091 RepID=UPI000D2FB284|nr:TolC family protein [Neisseria weaveri]